MTAPLTHPLIDWVGKQPLHGPKLCWVRATFREAMDVGQAGERVLWARAAGGMSWAAIVPADMTWDQAVADLCWWFGCELLERVLWADGSEVEL